MPGSVWILAVVVLLTAVRRFGRTRLAIWQVMLGGALAALASREIGPREALRAINPDVMLFLFGMFVIGRGLEDSGYLSELSYRLFRRARSTDQLVLLILFGMGLGAALLMNDTLAIVGTPVVLEIGRRHRLPAGLLLPALAFAVTIGSVASPIGNPQNLLIAAQGAIANPFVAFLRRLLVPTLLNLLLTYAILRLLFRRHFHRTPLFHDRPPRRDPALARLARVSLVVVLALIGAKVLAAVLRPELDFRLTWIALAGALPLLLCHPGRIRLVREADWPTLVFFAAMFVLMEAVWRSGFFQAILIRLDLDLLAVPAILAVSVLMSQLVSNVPLVALYLPVLQHAGAAVEELVALAAGSTIAGNLFILGAASNVIIVQAAERRGETISFVEFARIGIPVTAVNVLVYWVFL